MFTIPIDELADYDFKTIYDYLLSQQQTSFEILIPKENALGKDDQFYVFLDYYLAAYAGEKLAEVATVFSYYVPSVNQVSQFKFELEVSDIEKLADVLYSIVYGYYDPGDDGDDGFSFYEKAAQFHQDAWETFEAACWGLVTTAAEYMT